MKIHEYQGKEIFRAYGVPCPRGQMAETATDAVEAARALGGAVWVVKAQIHAGGRGKGGGVKVAKALDDVRDRAKAMLGEKLVTHQTGPAGQTVRKVYIEEGLKIARELYLGMTLDRAAGKVAVMLSAEGGMDIEEVARTRPEAILREAVDPTLGFLPFQGRRLAYRVGLQGKAVHQLGDFIARLYRIYLEKDATLVEVNPLILTEEGLLLALDAKLTFDDNALFRHPDVVAMRDLAEENPKEVEASKYDLNYIQLDGDIGCLVNGAGLAMSTMDIIKHFGGSPANFLDVGGGATVERVTAAFRILLSSGIKGIFVNIFGGIMRCDVIATALVTASKDVTLNVPLVARLQGTNVELGRKILAESGLKIATVNDMDEGAEKIVSLVAGRV